MEYDKLVNAGTGAFPVLVLVKQLKAVVAIDNSNTKITLENNVNELFVLDVPVPPSTVLGNLETKGLVL